MAKLLSVKMRDDTFSDMENVVRKLRVPRNTYINDAVAFYTKLYKRSLLAKQLTKESQMVGADSLGMLKEFESFQENSVG